MPDVDGADEDIAVGIQTEEGRIRDSCSIVFEYLQAVQILLKIMVIVFFDRSRNDFFAGSGPFVHHIQQLCFVLLT